MTVGVTPPAEMPDYDNGLPTPNQSLRSISTKPASLFSLSAEGLTRAELAVATVTSHLAKTAHHTAPPNPPKLGPYDYLLYDLNTITRRVCQDILVEYAETISSMEGIEIQALPPSAVETVTSDLVPTSIARKNFLLEFCNRSKDTLGQLLVLYGWARTYGKPNKKLIDLVQWERQTEDDITTNYDALGHLKAGLENFKLPPPDLYTALTVLGSSQPQTLRWPDFGLAKRRPASPGLAHDMLLELNALLHIRMMSHIGIGSDNIPLEMKNWSIKNGRVTFTVDGEFELDLSISEEEPNPEKSQWWFVDFRWAFTPSNQFPEISQQRTAIEGAVNEQLLISQMQLQEQSQPVQTAETPLPERVIGLDDASLQLAIDLKLAAEQNQAVVGSPDDEALNRIAEYALAQPSGAETSSPLEMQFKAAMAQEKKDISCLQNTFNFLHNFTLTHKINLLRHQALNLAYNSGRWVDTLHVETPHKILIVQYWKRVPGLKSWLEVGVKSGQVPVRTRDIRSGRLNPEKSLGRDWRGNLSPRIGVRWTQNGKIVDLERIPGAYQLQEQAMRRALQGKGHHWSWETELVGLGDLKHLDMESALQRMVCVHSIRMFERISHRMVVPEPKPGNVIGLSSPATVEKTALRVSFSVVSEAEYLSRKGTIEDIEKSSQMVYPQITVVLGSSPVAPPTTLQIEPLTGKLGLIPINERSQAASAILNRLDSQIRMQGEEVAKILKRHAALCLSDVIRDKASIVKSWKLERDWSVHRDVFNEKTKFYRMSVAHGRTMKLPPIVACHFMKPTSWIGLPWIIFCTITIEEGERWWVVEIESLGLKKMLNTSSRIDPRMTKGRFGSGPVYSHKVSPIEQVPLAMTVIPRNVFPIEPVQDVRLTPLEPAWFDYLESITVAAIGMRVARSHLSYLGVSHSVFTQQRSGSQAEAALDAKLASLKMLPISDSLRDSMPAISLSLSELLSTNVRKRKRNRGDSVELRKFTRQRSNNGLARSVTPALAQSMPPANNEPDFDLHEAGDLWAADLLRVSLLSFVPSDSPGFKSVFGRDVPVPPRGGSIPMVCYTVRGQFRPTVPAVRSLSLSMSKNKDGDSPSKGLMRLHISDNGAFSLLIPIALGDSFVYVVTRGMRQLARMVLIASELTGSGLGKRIIFAETDSITFQYDDPTASMNPTSGFAFPPFEMTIEFRDINGPCKIEMPEGNPHCHWKIHLEEVLNGPGFAYASQVRTGVRNLLFALSHTASMARSISSLQDLDSILTSILRPNCPPPSVETAIRFIDNIVSSRRFPPPVLRELARCRKRVVMQHNLASETARNSTNSNPMHIRMLLGSSVLTLQPTGVDISPRSFRSVRIQYSHPKLVVDARMVMSNGIVQWLFEFVQPALKNSSVGQVQGQGPQAATDEVPLVQSLRSMLNSKSTSWIGHSYGAIARVEGVDELVWRIDQVVRALRAASVSKSMSAQLQNRQAAAPVPTATGAG